MRPPNLSLLVDELKKRGLSIREITKALKISRNTVRKIIRSQHAERKTRSDKKHIPLDILLDTYQKCEQWTQRTHEELQKRGYKIGYSTLTRLLRETVSPCGAQKLAISHGDIPGKEFQHDTSPVVVKIGEQKQKLQLSVLYYRFSKVLYVRFYPYFRRFEMQCFLHEGIHFIGYVCEDMIIDNTNLAVLRGTGADAVMVIEMAEFAKSYGFEFRAHEVGHSDRKGGVEKNIHTVQINFLPGRTFTSLNDLNEQAVQWCRTWMTRKGRNGIPSELLALEQPFMKKIPPETVAPYMLVHRKSDQYGFIVYKNNYYWIGKPKWPCDVLIYSDKIVAYHQDRLLYDYPLFPHEAYLQRRLPPDLAETSLSPDRGRKAKRVESELRSLSPIMTDYLDHSFGQFRTHRSRQAFVRQLEYLAQRTPTELFITVIERALAHKIFDHRGVQRLIVLELHRQNVTPNPPLEPPVGDYQKRDVFQKLKDSTEPDWSRLQERFKKSNKKKET